MDHHGRPVALPDADLAILRRAAAALATQTGAGVPRAALVDLAEITRPLSVFPPRPGSGEPVLAVMALPGPGADPVFAGLTGQQRRVAQLVAAGRTNQQIARALSVTVGTVKDHVHQILTRTGLPSRAAVAGAWGGRPPSVP